MNFGCENHEVFRSDFEESSEKNNSVSENSNCSWDDDGSDWWRRACCCASALSRKGLKPSCKVKYPNAKAPITTTPDLIAFIFAVSFILFPSLLQFLLRFRSSARSVLWALDGYWIIASSSPYIYSSLLYPIVFSILTKRFSGGRWYVNC